MFRKMLVAGLALVALAASPAAAEYDFSVSPTVVQAGGVVTVSGEGCVPFSTVSVKVTQRSTGSVIYTGSDQTDANGEFTFDVQLPKNLAPGFYDLEARCPLDGSTAPGRALQGTVEGNDLVFRAVIEIVAAPGGGGGGGGGGVDDGKIVRTGSDLNGLGLVGAGLLTVGGLVLIASKRRRTSAA
ncbi:MAG: hypothetical protein KDB04_01030 [Acidimicrobiales bacterium]|nr:hypothetical protein [Acidimicrobiales bacterium]HRW38072.1 hypothetical protein [Aquihabitans sp.]